MTIVKNIKTAIPPAFNGIMLDVQVYIGRSTITDKHFGNPFKISKTESREQCVGKFKDWLDGKYPEIEPERRQWILNNISILVDKELYCYCKPLACHGDVLAKLANEYKE